MFKKIVFLLSLVMVLGASDLPVKVPDAANFKEMPSYGITTFLSIDALQSCIKDGDARGLFLDFSGIRKLLDGTVLNPPDTFFGTFYMGPYPFEAGETEYTYKRFRIERPIEPDTTVLPVGYFLGEHVNSEDWETEGQLVLRLELFLQTGKKNKTETRFLGLYDTFIRFRKESEGNKARFVKLVSLIEGPMVNLIRSDDPSRMVVSFKTDRAAAAAVVLKDGIALRRFESSQPARKHEITVTGLQPGKEYTYHVEYGSGVTKARTFRSAPKAGEGEVVFAYAGDSREGYGGGMNNFMGVNYRVLERSANLAYRLGADFFVFGGDLISGYTTSTADFRTQVHGFKQALAGFWRQRPVYPCIGNHEAIFKLFREVEKGRKYFVLDRWPYETDSVEAVFADELVNPLNGPETSDPRRPTYKENVYSFVYGPVKFIAFNNNYWLGKDSRGHSSPSETGGSPEGYIMEDQFLWIKKELKAGEKDPAIKYIILFAQEPVFPNGGHLSDCMWYYGNNDVRAFTYDAASGKVTPEKAGIIDVRNRLVKMVADNGKVAAVLGADEHSYHKVLIDKNVPIGVLALDNNGSGRVCRKGGTCSPLVGLKYPVWYLVCGGAGAPYYAKETTPWNDYWENYRGIYPNHTSTRGCFYYSSQENFFIFKANGDGISLTVYNPYGEIIDEIKNLMKVKENR
ncbi:MAG: metallophosphoesterase family protein [bacterium]|nr:metallophosphoesterase family protein [bacterium]